MASSSQATRDSNEGNVPILSTPVEASAEPSYEELEKQQHQADKVDGEAPPKLSWKQRAKQFIVEYGRAALCVHIVLSLLWLSLLYIAVSSGVDFSGVLRAIGLDSKNAAANSASAWLVAYAIYRIISPIRYAVTCATTIAVVRMLRRRGIMAPKRTDNRDDSASHRDDLTARSSASERASISYVAEPTTREYPPRTQAQTISTQ
ncbi:hypothetical protein PINS_up015568 [Pythium insidiosum]|nr:hypothetical protein PINS_up015568 [Pythium insidiosum]